MVGSGPDRKQVLIGLFILVGGAIAVTLVAGGFAHQVNLIVAISSAILGSAVALFTWKVNRERFYTAMLLGMLTAQIVSAQSWFLALSFAGLLVVVTLLRHSPGPNLEENLGS